MRIWTLILGLLLGGAITGCDRQPEPPAQRHKSPGRKGQTRSAKESRPQSVPPVPGIPTEPGATNSAPTATSGHDQEPLLGGQLPLYELKMDAAALMRLERSGHSNEAFPATFIADGEVFDRIKVRLRGQWARTWPKKPLKILFNHDHLFHGQECLNLNSGWRDPALVREPLAYAVYAACGVPAPRSRPVRLHVNGQFRGLYLEVEQPGKAFLRRWNLNGAAVFKAFSRANEADERDHGGEPSYRDHYERENRKTEGFGDLRQFCRELARTHDAVVFFDRSVDVNAYVNYLAATVLVQNWDCYNKNHFLVHDERNSQKWLVVPWDLDRTFGDRWDRTFGEARLPINHGTQQSPGVTGWNRLADCFLADPNLRSRFLDRLEELLAGEFTTNRLFPILDRWESQIGPTAALDRRRWPSPTPDLHRGIDGIKNYIERRRDYLAGEIKRSRREDPRPIGPGEK